MFKKYYILFWPRSRLRFHRRQAGASIGLPGRPPDAPV